MIKRILLVAAIVIVNSFAAFAQGEGYTLPGIKFKKIFVDFGDVVQGDSVKYVYEFENIGTDTVQIEDVRATCGCTVTNFDKTPVAPGGRGRIPITYNSQDKMGVQQRTIGVFSNGNVMLLKFRANVIPKK